MRFIQLYLPDNTVPLSFGPSNLPVLNRPTRQAAIGRVAEIGDFNLQRYCEQKLGLDLTHGRR